MDDLDAGDIVFVDLTPVRGSEQDGHRPALVLTDRYFHVRNAKAIICPITSNTRPWPTKVNMPPGHDIKGCVLIDQIRSVDRSVGGFRKIGTAPAEILAEVRLRLSHMLGISTQENPPAIL